MEATSMKFYVIFYLCQVRSQNRRYAIRLFNINRAARNGLYLHNAAYILYRHFTFSLKRELEFDFFLE